MNALIKIGLGLALAIIYPFMVGFGIEAFYAPPQQAYEVCLKVDPNSASVSSKTAKPQSYIDPQTNAKYKACYDKAQQKSDIYNRNLFLMAAGFGFIAIIVGTLLFSEKVGPVGPGLIFGGLFTILYGTMLSFRSVDKQWIFIELVVVFIGVILVTWRYLNTHKKESAEKKKTSKK